jgi:curved DNA-binding protein
MEFKDYYQVMGVAPDASSDDIKRAYRRLARKYHPDVSKETDAEVRFKELGEAYEVLKDPEKRAAYDRLGHNWKEGEEFRAPPDWDFHSEAEPDAEHLSDFFETLFGRAGRTGSTTFRGRGLDHTAQVSITLEEAFAGTNRELALAQVEPDASGRPARKTRQLKVKIPAGVTAGQQIRLTGQGAPGIGGGPRGDLFLQVQLLPHRFFQLEGRDLHLELPVTPWEAALGATVRVPTLSGKVDLRIPKGSQAGQQLRMKGRGLPGNPAGDQLLRLKIVTPAVSSPADEALYLKMAATMAMNPRQSME